MKARDEFSLISTGQLREINGGSFAYDLGRALRFYGLLYTRGVSGAVADWIMVDAVNQVAG
jgi:hypothetical protein